MELRRYIALFWRWAWLILLGTLLGGAAAYLLSINSTPVYRAFSRLLIDEAPGTAAGNEYAQVLLEQRLTLTYMEILKTRPVLEETLTRMELPWSPGQLASRTSVAAPQDTQIIVLNVEDIDPVRAAEIANTWGEVFIDQNQSRENLRYAEPIANWQRRQDELADRIEELEIRINDHNTPENAQEQASLSRLQTELQQAQIAYTEAFNNLNELQVALAKESSNVIQIEPSEPPASPVRPRVTTNTILSAIAGTLLAIGIVLLIEYLDDTLKNPDQVAESAGLATLGAIARISGSDPADHLVAIRAPRDPISEAYRVLRTNLGFSSIDGGLKSVLISSAYPGEGKSTTASNLAVVMAQTGKRVVLIDADLRRPSIHRFFDISNNQGLTTAVLDADTPTSAHLQPSGVPGLRIMTSGPIPPNPAELLSSQRMAQVLDALGEEAELLIFDSPPTLTVADASILAPQVDGCVLVVEVNKTRRDTLVQAAERLGQANAVLFGVVLNLLSMSRRGYYYYYYYDYYYSREYSYDRRGSRGRRRRRRKGQQPRLPAWLTGLGRR